MPNKSGIDHNIAIDGNGKRPIVKSGNVVVQGDARAPASYTYFCTVPGHRQAGMQGTLTVK